jgi:hypothetical protein
MLRAKFGEKRPMTGSAKLPNDIVVRLAGIEPAHPAPEAGALSIGPQARILLVEFLYFSVRNSPPKGA